MPADKVSSYLIMALHLLCILAGGLRACGYLYTYDGPTQGTQKQELSKQHMPAEKVSGLFVHHVAGLCFCGLCDLPHPSELVKKQELVKKHMPAEKVSGLCCSATAFSHCVELRTEVILDGQKSVCVKNFSMPSS
jgi:hypothetical protein